MSTSSLSEDQERLLQDVNLEGEKVIRPRVRADYYFFLCLAILIVFFSGILLYKNTEDHSARGALAVGHDYAGQFVPYDVYAQPQLTVTSANIYEISAATFESTAILNETIMLWNTLAPGASFVSAKETEWHGSEKPVEMHGSSHLGLSFQITAFHQMHCLTTILRDYSLLLQGFAPDQLYDDRGIATIKGHSAHCFNEIRRAVTCLADSTSIGYGEDPSRVESAGKLHVCNSYDALLEWASDPVRKFPETVRGGY